MSFLNAHTARCGMIVHASVVHIIIIIAALSICTLANAQSSVTPAVRLSWTLVEDEANTLNEYPVTNMKDGNKSTTWVGRLTDSELYGDGVIAFRFKVKAKSLEYIVITPGYAKSADLFMKNCRPKNICVYDGTVWYNDAGEACMGPYYNDDVLYPKPLADVTLYDSPVPQIIKLKPRSGEFVTNRFHEMATHLERVDDCA